MKHDWKKIELIDFYRVSLSFSIGSIESNRAQSLISKRGVVVLFSSFYFNTFFKQYRLMYRKKVSGLNFNTYYIGQ